MIDEFRGEHRYLSNFYPVLLHFEGLDFPTLEHAYQAAKFLDREVREGLSQIRKPGTVKRLAKEFKKAGLQRPDWHDINVGTMKELLEQKFGQAPFGSWLVYTGDVPLVEGNTWHDNFWGTCRCGRDECLAPGRNMLGKLLMGTREKLWMCSATT